MDWPITALPRGSIDCPADRSYAGGALAWNWNVGLVSPKLPEASSGCGLERAAAPG